MSRRSQSEALVDFAVAVQREIVIRCGTFKPATDSERVWAKLGLCEPFELTTVQEALGRDAAVA